MELRFSGRGVFERRNQMRYALALEGGGARGAFHAGVWKACLELGIPISAICGTSIGAINGAMFASGADAVFLWQDIRVTDVLDVPDKTGVAALVSYAKAVSKGGIDTTPLRKFLETHFSEDALRESPIDFGLSTCTAKDMQQVNLFKEDIPQGEMIDYILASASFPLFKPAIIDGKQYIDGGMRNNLPINMLADKGHKNIIAVSIRGVGLKSDADICDVNVIEIKAPEAEVGILTFDSEGIAAAIDSGYCETMRVFGKYVGKKYYFLPEDYARAALVYGKSMLNRLEKAAEILGIYPYRVYEFCQLRDLVLSSYKKHKALSAFVSYMKKGERSFLHSKLSAIPGIFDGANAIVYFENVK